jgi:polynucleotide 5'-hydroxyl-kinase GRC3/NOL9
MTNPVPPTESPALPDERAAPYAEWETPLATIAAAGGVTLLLGGTDVGKTTFTRLLLNRVTESGQCVALVDADLGQSEVGPPGCVGLALAEKPVPALSELSPHALAFVGSVSPPGHLLEYVAAIRRLADLGQASHPALLLIDTSGYLHGSAARRLYQTLFDLLSPAHIVALQRRDELEPILAPMRRREGCSLYAPPIPTVIRVKPPGYRAQRRAMRFSATFEGATLHTYSLEEVTCVGTWMGTGTPVAAHILKFLNQTLEPRARVYYAEMAGRHLGLMVSHPLPHNALGLGLAQEQLKAQAVSITVAPRLKHLLLGLEGANGKLLGLGLLEALDFRRRTLGVVTPVRAPGAACVLHFGSLRITPDGSEVGSLKPGEL